VGSNELGSDIAVLGDAPNIAARLSSSAAIGEILISEDAFVQDANLGELEKQQLALRGKSKSVSVYVVKAP
jgi:class 3 adenylate cyclase